MDRIKVNVLLDTGEEHALTITNQALVAWDRTRVIRDWPKHTEAPSLWLTFLAWHQMKAMSLVDCEYPEFEEKRCVTVADADDDEEEPTPQVDPTQPGPDPDSA